MEWVDSLDAARQRLPSPFLRDGLQEGMETGMRLVIDSRCVPVSAPSGVWFHSALTSKGLPGGFSDWAVEVVKRRFG